MSEYIEREATVAKITELINQSGKYTDYECGADDACFIVNHIPAANVRPAVRGKWRFEIGDGKTCVDGWVCSACNCGFHTNVPYFEGFNFCPNCGADMREES